MKQQPFFAPWLRQARMALIGSALAFCGVSGTMAASFEIAVSPSRFELSGKGSERTGQSLTIHNVGATATEVSVRTLDWTFSEDGMVAYHDELLSGSCRPWITLERKTIKINARSRAQFRFQFDIPADAPRGECRAMLAFEGMEPAHQAFIQSGGASLSLPVSGRIGVAIYLAVNGAEPQISLQQIGVKTVQGKRVPVVTVMNTGDAHGRLDGSLDAIDAQGLEVELVPDSSPILPGQTRMLELQPRTEPGQQPRTLTLPAQAKGTLDWERGSFKINAQFQ